MLLSGILSLILGAYWLLRPLKDSVFLTMVGPSHLGRVKIISVCMIIPVIILITKLVDIFPRHRILCSIALAYSALSILFAWLIMHPELGINNTIENPARLLGWTFYIFVETIGIVLVSLFWSFAADITTPDSAKRGYPLIILASQCSSALFPFIAEQIVYRSTSGVVVACGSLVFLCIPILISYFMKVVPNSQLVGFKELAVPIEGKPPKPTFYEGLQLIFTRPYLLALFAIVTFQEIILTMFDFQLKGLAKTAIGGGDALTTFIIRYAMWANLIAFLCALLGAGKLSNKLGLTKTLLIMPICVAFGGALIGYAPNLTIIFWMLVALKGIHYSFNTPAKEQLYIPTSKDSKYKAKSWIDMFGSRSSKSIGAGIHDTLKSMGPELFIGGTLTITMGLIGLWAFAALFLGKTHTRAIRENRVVC